MSLAIKTWWEMERRFILDDLTLEERMNQASIVEGSIRYGLFEPLRELGAVDLWMSAVDSAVRITPLGLWGIGRLKSHLGLAEDGAKVIDLFGRR